MPVEDYKFSVVTLGCPKNKVESEFIKDSLEKHGYQAADAKESEIIIVNTCGFIQAAKEEAIETILDFARFKKEGRCRLLIVAGCMAQRYHRELYAELPEVDGIIGISHHSKLPSYIVEMARGKRLRKAGPMPRVYSEERARGVPEGPSAYLQISDGCDNACAYCAIPLIRGRYRSRSIQSLMSEAENLAAHGVKEIVLIGQDTAFYGADTGSGPQIGLLLDRLSSLEGLEWIRLLYCQPQNVTDELVRAIADNPKVCPYLDIPFQHAGKRVLSSMNRNGDADQYMRLIDNVRRRIPDIALRTSLIIGFPGETDRDFEELLGFIEKAGLDYIGLFEYSREEKTAAARMPDQIPDEIVRERFRAVSDLSDRIAFDKCRAMLGKKSQVLLEEAGQAYFCGRSNRQAPEIDGEVLVKKDGNSLKIGDIIDTKIVQADLYSFEGEPIV